jgi:GR25 family glycosyltransferase involved in LPS biosynthesis
VYRRARVHRGTAVCAHQLNHAIGIVAHVARAKEAHKLMRDVRASYSSLDNGAFGCHLNHKKVWRYLAERQAPHHEWCVVLEDDAIPCKGFRTQLEQALAATTAPIVSLYLGRLRPPHWQYMIEPATARADAADASFIVSRQLLHAVGLAVRSDLVKDMLANLNEELPIDEAIGEWANKRRYRIAYTWPSLVDHADGETLLQHRDGQAREPGRVAWKFGVRSNWSHTYVEMN